MARSCSSGSRLRNRSAAPRAARRRTLYAVPEAGFCSGLHDSGDLASGRVGWVAGPMLAGSTAVDIVVRGKGGHGAAPNETTDPIVLASLLVLDLQTIVSREVKPTDPAVVTVGRSTAAASTTSSPTKSACN